MPCKVWPLRDQTGQIRQGAAGAAYGKIGSPGKRCRGCFIAERGLWCQISGIFDSGREDFQCQTAEAVRHFHPNRQANLTHCAGGKASAMRDEADLQQLATLGAIVRVAG